MAEQSEKISVNAEPARQQPLDVPIFVPLVDIYQVADGTVKLEVELPGATSGDVDLRVEKGVLTITADGRLPEVPGDFKRTHEGFQAGRYERAFALSDEIDREKIECSLIDGVLTVTLPRAASAQTRKIEVKQG